jgi:2-polyprenyl-3-methyl-5-hydroxy-6-metoxy-1,4-benzoquinol methylase
LGIKYDEYYQASNFFGDPIQELIDFFDSIPSRGTVLDVGCGQGRDAIALARLGFHVTGIDHSRVGIEQVNQVARKEKLPLKGLVADIYSYRSFDTYDFILFDSMFHFLKKDRKKETDFIRHILSKAKPTCMLVFCIQDTGDKVNILNQTLDTEKPCKRKVDLPLVYHYHDTASGHHSETTYRLIVAQV